MTMGQKIHSSKVAKRSKSSSTTRPLAIAMQGQRSHQAQTQIDSTDQHVLLLKSYASPIGPSRHMEQERRVLPIHRSPGTFCYRSGCFSPVTPALGQSSFQAFCTVNNDSSPKGLNCTPSESITWPFVGESVVGL